jgi:hypothetical protein
MSLKMKLKKRIQILGQKRIGVVQWVQHVSIALLLLQ